MVIIHYICSGKVQERALAGKFLLFQAMQQKIKDWLKHNRQLLYEQVAVCTVPTLDANLERFGMGPDTPAGAWYQETFIKEAYEPFVAAFRDWANPTTRTPLIITQMQEAEKKFIPVYRELYKVIRGNPVVTGVDLEEMGFPYPAGGKRTPAPVAATVPAFQIDFLDGHRVRIRYYPADSPRRRGKPRGQYGAEIRWVFSENVIRDPSDMTRSVFQTASPCILTFDGDEPPIPLYVALRWVNTRGQHGPWSRIQGMIVPG
jgi:hypothetical protein